MITGIAIPFSAWSAMLVMLTVAKLARLMTGRFVKAMVVAVSAGFANRPASTSSVLVPAPPSTLTLVVATIPRASIATTSSPAPVLICTATPGGVATTLIASGPAPVLTSRRVSAVRRVGDVHVGHMGGDRLRVPQVDTHAGLLGDGGLRELRGGAGSGDLHVSVNSLPGVGTTVW